MLDVNNVGSEGRQIDIEEMRKTYLPQTEADNKVSGFYDSEDEDIDLDFN